MRTNHRYWAACVLLVILIGLLLGGLSFKQFITNHAATQLVPTDRQNLTHTSSPTVVTQHATATPTVHSVVTTPTPQRHASPSKNTSQSLASSGPVVHKPANTTSSSYVHAASISNVADTNGNLDMSTAHLLIPAINLNASIESLGVNTDGSLQVPQQNPWTAAGWYKDGPVPGDQGSAVIDGHLDRPGGYPATFWNLRYLHSGDKVIVEDAEGNRVNFHVTRLEYYPPNNAPLDQIFGDTSGNYLNLITCAGTWIPARHQTTLRLVVYTTLDQ